MNQPLLAVNNLTHLYAPDKGFRDVSFELWPGEVLGIVGESGSGKTTLLKAISARLTPQQGEVLYQQRSLYAMSEAERRRLLRTEWGVVHQHPMDGLCRQVSAGGNIGERLMATGARHYGNIRATAEKWLQEVEIPPSRIDNLPTTFSGGMQQRLQIARNLVTATPRKVLEVRKITIGWVSQFLRVIPRISALEVVMQPLLDLGTPREASAAKAAQLLTRLNVPERLWHLAPSTFSGGEQQRVNIARGFAVDYPILLLDEPTASLDDKNSAAVVNLIHDAKARGAAIVGIFHDEGVRRQVADRLHSMGMTA
ncbi:phosphonate C-P lyase system protein PhnK [Klebsiella pneumoniae subsp. rhinoscleromatis]|nr:phosphonate C-P lyase system protein PhnK [Klebsiella pneumoniae subsp. rhinoscleromatis]